jgi:hypothetical protein
MPLYPMKFAFSTENNERIEAVVTIPKEQRSILHGTVYDTEGKRIPDAVVRLFAYEQEQPTSISDAITDGDGEFVFGPLAPDKRYLVKVYVNGVTLRELVVKPRRTKKQQ